MKDELLCSTNRSKQAHGSISVTKTQSSKNVLQSQIASSHIVVSDGFHCCGVTICLGDGKKGIR